MTKLISFLSELAERRLVNVQIKVNLYNSKVISPHEFFLFFFPFVFNDSCLQFLLKLHHIHFDKLLLEEIESACSTVGRVESIVLGICGVKLNAEDKSTIVSKLMEILCLSGELPSSAP